MEVHQPNPVTILHVPTHSVRRIMDNLEKLFKNQTEAQDVECRPITRVPETHSGDEQDSAPHWPFYEHGARQDCDGAHHHKSESGEDPDHRAEGSN